MVFTLLQKLLNARAFFEYRRLAGSTRCCLGHYIKIIKCIVRAKVARKVSPRKVARKQGSKVARKVKVISRRR